MEFTLASLKDHQASSVVPYTVNPFASFILIHSILRDIFSTHNNSKSSHGRNPQTCTIDHGGGVNGVNAVSMIHGTCLDNWQKMWYANPESIHSGGESYQELPFVSNAIPFYWLARFAETAKQNGTIHIGPAVSRNDMEDRYRLVKTWLMQISSCLRSGSQIPPNLWNNPTAVGLSTFSDIST